MSEEYPLYPSLTEQGKEEAQLILDSFKPRIKAMIDELLSELYCDVVYYIESDSWTNYRNALMDGFKNYRGGKPNHSYDYKELRQAIYKNHKEEDYTIINYKDTTMKEIKTDLLGKPIITNLEYNYKVIKQVTLKDIIDKNLCHRELAKLINDMIEKDCYMGIVFDIVDIYMLPTLRRNIKWLEENGFVGEIKRFKPFDLTLKIGTKEELKELWCRLNMSYNDYQEKCKGMEYFDDVDATGDLYRAVNKEMWRVK